MSEPSDPLWRYGVYAFVVPPALLALSYLGVAAFVQSAQTESPLLALGSLALTALSSWLAYPVVLVVAVSLFLDARALSDSDRALNEWFAGLLGLVHVAGAVVAVPYLVSVPGIGYYLYRRRQHVRG